MADQTIERAKELGVAVEMLPTWYDVDDGTTLHRLCAELLSETASSGFAALETRNFLLSIVKREGRDRIWPNE